MANPTSRFLALPAEVRYRIYRLVSDPQVIVSNNDTKIQITPTGHPRPPLVNTCKQIRSESLQMFYHENKFSIDNSNVLLKWYITIAAMGLTGFKRMRRRIWV
ncbi:hypothetical protein CLAFUW4_13597 [Fulvia fulva]|uniref:2EXR domain-containing protein n=1 Tax=Passalora fulva TaxID=5499 RepID=A0A9Q8PKP9_PASFU|nr:uncharacterized protein CLAFUR5_13449 [Fulvia fulva]KAK4610588.1 hypothetical protein CLAFUR4_13600 [Fulvia fulva]KAK4611262.1 hypothetical protein CLAFUR0_13605 [Fulvia fulva]UJO24182.1 hypothetical protein CLAFUR5_13449 [Fulvia fulva]WPV21755.1 hypothetical protein CLAFUW4_13597 [Fulvia fulva]WPV37050.1 hypothetical protein CLAFUW7_13605 [Fulvia fulva]